MELLIENLIKMNRWWKDKSVEKAFLFNTKRDIFYQLKDCLNEKRITSIIGPRRVGKTTLMYQLINHLMESGIKEKNILFMSGDEPLIVTSKINIEEIIELYFSNILHENLSSIKTKVYILIDEIHFFSNWELYLKSYFDKKYNIKFVISGSSSIHLLKDSKDSLLGRISDQYIYPLSYKEFIGFSNEYLISNQVKNAFSSIDFQLDNIKALYNDIYKNVIDKSKYEIKATKLLENYLLVGGYPEYFEVKNLSRWQRYLVDDAINKGLYRDIVKTYNIANPSALEKLFYYISYHSGQTFSYTSIAKDLAIDTQTVIKYTKYLKDAFLLSINDNYSPNLGKVIRKNKKLSIIDSGVINALQRNREIINSDIGLLVETAISKKISQYAIENNYKSYYWKKDKKEVDVIVDNKKSIIPVEVKYRENIKKTDLNSVKYFMETYKCSNGVIITKNLFKFEENIYFIPAWIFLLI